MSGETDELPALVPVLELMPSQPRRWVFKACRTGMIPGAVKCGRTWLITVAAFKAWAESQQGGPAAAAEPSAVDELRAAGWR